ncbi:MAG: DUF6473 family protein [Paracoccaceae bacterium]
MPATPPDREILEFDTYRFGRSRMPFRGPRPDISGRFVACLGGCDTIARFVKSPYPLLLERRLGLPVANWGSPDATPADFLADPVLLEACSGASACVVQVMPAVNISGALYALFHRRAGVRSGPRDILRLLEPVLDPERYWYCTQTIGRIRASREGVFSLAENELRLAWIFRMQALLRAIRPPKILLWMAQRAPGDPSGGMSVRSPGAPPSLVNRPMLDAVAPFADGLVEYTAPPDEAWGRDGDRIYRNGQEILAHRHAGGDMHRAAARALARALEPFLPEVGQRRTVQDDGPAAAPLVQRQARDVFEQFRVRVRPLGDCGSLVQRAASSAGTASKRSATSP